MTRRMQLRVSMQYMTFDCYQAEVFIISMQADVQGGELKNCVPGRLYTFIFGQDAAGGHKFAWPPQCQNGMKIDTTPSSYSIQNFVASSADVLQATEPGGFAKPAAFSGMVYPPTGIAVSNGDSWAASLDPIATFLRIAGGTLTGPLTLAADPATALQAATKQYVDAHTSMVYPPAGIPVSSGATWETSLDPNNTFLKLAGGTLTGALALAADPTANLQAATKQYVDTSGPKVIQVANEATAISQSTANPNNLYFWV